jgi:hypothetical protein
MYAAGMQPGRGTYKYSSRRLLHGLLTTTSILCLSTSAVAFPSSPLPFSLFVLINASPLCRILRYISLPETITAPSSPHITRCEKHAVLPSPPPLLCISRPFPVYCALCSAFSPLILNLLLPLYAQDEGIDNRLCSSALRSVDHPRRTTDDYPSQTLRHRLA